MSKVIAYRSAQIIPSPFTFIIHLQTFINQWSKDVHGIRYTFSFRCDKKLCKTANNRISVRLFLVTETPLTDGGSSVLD